MAKSPRRSFGRTGDLDERFGPVGPDGFLPGAGPLPPLFTWGHDNVNFVNVDPNEYDPASYYSAQRGNDTVVLPVDQAKATAIGYDPSHIFHGDAGDDFIVGGQMNDRISGDTGNDRLFGNAGDDLMMGSAGHDQLFGATGNDELHAGDGLDYIDAGAGNDLIFANDDDGKLLAVFESYPGPFGGKLYEDEIQAGAGDDVVHATASDRAFGGAGNDSIFLYAYTMAPGIHTGVAAGGTGDDTIIGSTMRDWINTGDYDLFWSMEDWNPLTEALTGGYTDVVASGPGDDIVNTAPYCNATVHTGAGNDQVFVLGLADLVSTGDGQDVLNLWGGACKADLGAGNDVLWMSRAAYDNPNVSEITLGAGVDGVYFATNEWFTSGDQQSLARAPWILDFDPDVDQVTRIDVTNLDDATQSLNADYIETIGIAGGAAVIYDDPLDDSRDFCFARFKDVSAAELQANMDLFTIYA
jgi:Ca2+-binding RTX toxin-like protein